MNNEFLKFVTITFLANIWVYWLSPETRPRYLLMLYPLVFIVWAHAFYTYRAELPKRDRVVKHTFLGLAALVTLALPAALFFSLETFVSHLPLKVVVVFVASGFFTWLIYRLQKEYIFPFIGFLLVIRLAFSWFVLPHRLHHGESNYYRRAAIEIGKITDGKPLYFYQYKPELSNIPFHDRLIFYMERTRMQKVKFVATDAMPGYYFTFDRDIKHPEAELIKSFNGNLKLFRVK